MKDLMPCPQSKTLPVLQFYSSCNTLDVTDGSWSQWGCWSKCSITCGTGGKQTRKRECTHPPPSNGGLGCTGTNTEVKECNRSRCAKSKLFFFLSAVMLAGNLFCPYRRNFHSVDAMDSMLQELRARLPRPVPLLCRCHQWRT